MAQLRAWAAQLRRRGLALYLVRNDERVPRAARWLILIAVAYALSPVDLIPDFIPVLGYLDDLLLVPLLIWLALRMVSPQVWHRGLELADQYAAGERRARPWAGVAVALMWLGASVLVVIWIWS